MMDSRISGALDPHFGHVNLLAMASNLEAMASIPLAMASNLLAMASILRAMASNLLAMA